jgi:hypothetical protein
LDAFIHSMLTAIYFDEAAGEFAGGEVGGGDGCGWACASRMGAAIARVSADSVAEPAIASSTA